ncbi:hypothetical protein GGR95_001458 [Sulfitobacter undariae]|uniref:DUF192 domain-containing protein n=1 Tax=Sulfitobacter undariae TaxID=1563671 RepID=A0A7W6H088_9RHOB|nr:hypothetical protein [Sulfitobacter undariae]
MGNSHFNRRRVIAGLGALAVGAGPLTAKTPRYRCPTGRVTIQGGFGTAAFNVDVAADVETRARGLMYVKEMPLSRGMLFVYPAPQLLSFWMRNTLIELDMLFLDRFGVIQKIHHRAVPLNETPISGGDQLLTGVLEINGGLAKRMGIAQGDILRHPAFISQSEPWSCS